ncbi:MAG TPA: glycosyl hydrolase family 8, partial [Solirubrobacteraceae bacterium]|nr:glycosyl hydrolase family 8 [Solirubrobacteraceae bacterium]
MTVQDTRPAAPATEAAPESRAVGAVLPDPRLGRVRWPIPSVESGRRRAIVMAMLCIPLAIWYLSWLLQGQRIGNPVLFGLLIAAEAFNLVQAIGFWWTCAHQRLRGGLAPTAVAPVDVMIPVYDEPLTVVEPTVAAACALRGAEARVWVLDDADRDELEVLADRYGAGYIRRAEHSGAKAGNLNHALALTGAPYVIVLDCDHVPHIDFLERTLGYLEDPEVAFVQTPQYYANASRSPVSTAAAAQQNLFFGPICRGKDGLGAMMCTGTNVAFRRDALKDAGGFPEGSITEDFLLSVRLHELGWRSVYLSEVVASGLGPEDMASYVSQQQRWARGCLSAIPAVLRSRLPWRARAQYLLSATYFLSGWTLLLYMSLPVVRLLFGLQPLARISADQFLIHFAPYYCGALGAVALAGSGTYTFGAFALASSSFWIHVQASINALLRRAARFVVTPKHGASVRQPRAVAPVLVTVAVLIGASVYGLVDARGPATLNNVAFAALHSSILLIGIAPALLLRRSPLLAPEAPTVTPRQPRRSLPRPLWISALGVALLVPVALSVIGSQALRMPASLNQQAYASAESFMSRYVGPDGRVIRRDQGGDTVSEGQAYGMLLAVALDNQARFKTIWGWTRSHLQQPSGLLASDWSNGRVVSARPATDADLDAADALVLAGQRFGNSSYRDQGVAIARAILDHETTSAGSRPVLVAGPWAQTDPAVINPSYFSPRAYADLAGADHDPRWELLASSSRSIVSELTNAGRSLPPDWANARVVSARPATDADLDAADALVLAGQRFGNSSYRDEGVAIARAILAHETTTAGTGPVLVAGPWARTDPAVINPSYFSPRAYADLAGADHDPRW